MLVRLALASALVFGAGACAAQGADVVQYLRQIAGTQSIACQQDGPNPSPDKWTRHVRGITGAEPAMWGGDFGFEPFDVENRSHLVKHAALLWSAGVIPMLSWHACPPTVGSSCQWDSGEGAILSKLTDAQWQELTSEGTALHTKWKRRLDEIVPHLRELKARRVPVLFRPLHEMNDGWSWWGGRSGPEGSAKLYRITHQYLREVHGLDHLVWVWNVKDVAGGVPQLGQYWPGTAFVDVVTLDAWVNKQPPRGWYEALLRLAGDKPIGLAETGSIPSPETLTAQPKWSFLCVWREKLAEPAWNSPESVRRTYSDARVLKRGQLAVKPRLRGGRTSARP